MGRFAWQRIGPQSCGMPVTGTVQSHIIEGYVALMIVLSALQVPLGKSDRHVVRRTQHLDGWSMHVVR